MWRRVSPRACRSFGLGFWRQRLVIPSPGDGHLPPVLLHTWGPGWLFSSAPQLPSIETVIASISAVAAGSLITHELGDSHRLLGWALPRYWHVLVAQLEVCWGWRRCTVSQHPLACAYLALQQRPCEFLQRQWEAAHAGRLPLVLSPQQQAGGSRAEPGRGALLAVAQSLKGRSC